jgi:hypothetical protein
MSQSGFPETYLNLSKVSSECRHFSMWCSN